jgi:hypothetical protein
VCHRRVENYSNAINREALTNVGMLFLENAFNLRGQTGSGTHLTFNRCEKVFIELLKFHTNGSRRKFNRYCHRISDKVKSVIEGK